MDTQQAGQHGHDIERPRPGMVHVHHQQHQRGHDNGDIPHIPARDDQRLAVNLARQFAVGNDRAGEGHSTDKDTEENLNLMDDLFCL